MKLPYKSYDDKRLNVMLCNHMDAHCRYIESLMKLSEIDNGKMVVYAQAAGYTMETPYVKEVVTIGEKLFKERFKAVFEWLSYEELCQQINNMDIGIFNIDRQMGQGTALLFAYYGKKVYFSKENTNYDSFLDDGIKVFRFDNIEERDFYEAPDMEFMDYNRTTIDELFDDKYFRKTWEEILAINK